MNKLHGYLHEKEFLKKNSLKDEADLKNNLEKSLKMQFENGLKQIEKKM